MPMTGKTTMKAQGLVFDLSFAILFIGK